MLQNVEALHDGGVVHLDVKPGNLAIIDGHVHLLDFSHSLELDAKGLPVMPEGYEPCGTRGFAASELQMRIGDIGKSTDVYGCGATFMHEVQHAGQALHRVAQHTLTCPFAASSTHS